jgi:hypothetical protein
MTDLLEEEEEEPLLVLAGNVVTALPLTGEGLTTERIRRGIEPRERDLAVEF